MLGLKKIQPKSLLQSIASVTDQMFHHLAKFIFIYKQIVLVTLSCENVKFCLILAII